MTALHTDAELLAGPARIIAGELPADPITEALRPISGDLALALYQALPDVPPDVIGRVLLRVSSMAGGLDVKLPGGLPGMAMVNLLALTGARLRTREGS